MGRRIRLLEKNYVRGEFTKGSIIEKTYSSENLPQPLFAKEGEFLFFLKPACR